MSQYYASSQEPCANAVPVKVNRVFDSCSDRDCLTGVQVQLDEGTTLPDTVTLVKTRCVRVTNICMSVEPVPFNRGFYSIDLTYTFSVEMMTYERACGSPTLITGTAYASKNVILCGGESSTKTFFSNALLTPEVPDTTGCGEMVNLPTAAVQVVEPIALETRLVTTPGEDGAAPTRTITLTLGMFSVVELYRPTTVLVPTYEYTIPTKECHSDTESPCAVFDRIRFPAEEFTTGKMPCGDGITDCGCGSAGNCGGGNNNGCIGCGTSD